jgi:Spy/CpxP family protein refolding chaperone
MKDKTIQVLAMAALTAGLGLAQTPANPPAPQEHAQSHLVANGQRRHEFARRRLVRALNLSDAQKQQAKAIFGKSRRTTAPLVQELRANRMAMAQAVNTNASADIRRLSEERGRLTARLTAVHSQARAEFLGILTPAQKAKAEQLSARFHQHPRTRANG